MDIMVESGTELPPLGPWKAESWREAGEGLRTVHTLTNALTVDPQVDEPIVRPGSQDQITSMIRFTSRGLHLQYISLLWRVLRNHAVRKASVLSLPLYVQFAAMRVSLT